MVYSKVIDILKELAATGNVKESLDKIDDLIDKLQEELDDDRQPSMPLDLEIQPNNPFLSPKPKFNIESDMNTCDQKRT